jgi:hypothetical protein
MNATPLTEDERTTLADQAYLAMLDAISRELKDFFPEALVGADQRIIGTRALWCMAMDAAWRAHRDLTVADLFEAFMRAQEAKRATEKAAAAEVSA